MSVPTYHIGSNAHMIASPDPRNSQPEALSQSLQKYRKELLVAVAEDLVLLSEVPSEEQKPQLFGPLTTSSPHSRKTPWMFRVYMVYIISFRGFQAWRFGGFGPSLWSVWLRSKIARERASAAGARQDCL